MFHIYLSPEIYYARRYSFYMNNSARYVLQHFILIISVKDMMLSMTKYEMYYWKKEFYEKKLFESVYMLSSEEKTLHGV